MSSNVLKLQQDMADVLIAKSTCSASIAEVEAKVASTEYGPSQMLRDYIVLLAIAKRKGYNGFSDGVSELFIETTKTAEPNRMVALDKSGVTT